MKLKFDATLEYQHDAIAAVADLFEGMPSKQSAFEISAMSQKQMHLFTELGVGNLLMIDDDQLLKNLQAVQVRNNIARSRSLIEKDGTYGFPQFFR